MVTAGSPGHTLLSGGSRILTEFSSDDFKSFRTLLVRGLAMANSCFWFVIEHDWRQIVDESGFLGLSAVKIPKVTAKGLGVSRSCGYHRGKQIGPSERQFHPLPSNYYDRNLSIWSPTKLSLKLKWIKTWQNLAFWTALTPNDVITTLDRKDNLSTSLFKLRTLIWSSAHGLGGVTVSSWTCIRAYSASTIYECNITCSHI